MNTKVMARCSLVCLDRHASRRAAVRRRRRRPGPSKARSSTSRAPCFRAQRHADRPERIADDGDRRGGQLPVRRRAPGDLRAEERSSPGFLPQESQPEVIVGLGKTVLVEFTLKVGGVTENVEVDAPASAVDVKSSATANQHQRLTC